MLNTFVSNYWTLPICWKVLNFLVQNDGQVPQSLDEGSEYQNVEHMESKSSVAFFRGLVKMFLSGIIDH